MRVGRKKPYTAIGIRRKACCRCGGQAEHQWQCCATGNLWMPLCIKCDIALNAVALRFVRHPNATALLKTYRDKAQRR